MEVGAVEEAIGVASVAFAVVNVLCLPDEAGKEAVRA